MIGRVYAIALNTFREAVRKRSLYAILILVVGVNLFAVVLGEMSLHEEARVARDVGLFSISFFGVVAAIVLGAMLLHGEVQKRTIHNILSKPLERHEFVVGKYLGMALTLSLMVGLFAAAMTGILILRDVELSSAMVKAVLLSYTEVLVVAAIAVLFSAFSSPALSGVFTAAMWFVGNRTEAILKAMESSDMPQLSTILEVTLYVVPDLHALSISGGQVAGEYVSVHGDFVSWGYTATAVGHGLLYIGMLLLFAIVIFSRRDFA